MPNKIIAICFGIICLLPASVKAAVSLQSAPETGQNAYWTFEAKTIDWNSSTLFDTTNNSNDGTIFDMTPASNQAKGKIGQSLFFDGSADYITLASNPIATVSSPSTICAWVNTNNISLAPVGWNQTFLNLYTDVNNGIHMGSVVNTGSFFVSYRSGGSYYGAQTTSSVFSNNSWVHTCYVWSGSGISLYANGVSLSTTTNVDSIGTVNVIGARNDLGDGSWSGYIDDIRVYSRALTLSEIQKIYHGGALVLGSVPNGRYAVATTPPKILTSGLVGHWTFDGNKINWGANTVTDSSGNGNTGTINNMSTTTSPAQGRIGQALSFDGVNDYVQTISPVDFGGTKIISLSFWAKIDSYTNDGASTIELSTIYNNNDGAFRVALDGVLGTPLAGIQDGTTGSPSFRSESFPTQPSAGVWHHYVIILDNSTATGDVIAYLDGVLQSLSLGINTKNQSSAFKTDTLYLMSRAGTSLFENGSLDDLRIYNRALSATEVSKLYGIGR